MSFQIDGLDAFSQKLTRLADQTDDVVKEAVAAGGEIVREDMRAAVVEAANRGYATGALADSIKAGGVRSSGGGASVTIAPSGTVKKVRNSDKAWYLEHGTARQAAHPFMAKTMNTAKPKVMQAMQEKLDAAIGGVS